MATAQHKLTPATDTTPVTVKVPEKELSGEKWVNRFPGSSKLDDLTDPFKTNLKSFKAAIDAAGGEVTINATLRPKERAYLMHWSWKISNKKETPKKVPAMDGVSIEWDHGDDKASVAAAEAMVQAYGMKDLKIAPALDSMHTQSEAVDMNITWTGELTVNGKDGTAKKITSTPKDGMNEDLHLVGKGYGVIKFLLGAVDKPHWSSNGK